MATESLVFPTEPTNARPGSDALWTWSAVALTQAIRTRHVSAREVVHSCLERADAINPLINALTEVHHDAALFAADEADRAVAAGKPLGPLHGVPVSTKVNIDQRGYATTNGVTLFADNIADDDAPSIAKVRQAGAILTARSNAPAFSLRWFSSNDLHGVTLNPWSKAHTPGGSSGGAAAAVAAGMMPIAIGNDIGGSIRHPAYCCGVTGIRPTVGRVPRWFGPKQSDQPFCVQLMATDGPIARSVGDLRLALSAMSGFDPRDLLSLPAFAKKAPLSRPVRVGVLRTCATASLSPQVCAALDRAAVYLADAGYIVEDIELPFLEEAYRLWYLLAMQELRELLPLMEQAGDHGALTAMRYFTETAADWWGTQPALSDYMHGYARRGTLIAQLQTVLESCPIIVLPVSAEQAFPQNLDIKSLEGAQRAISANWSMMGIATLGFPAMSVPVGVADGLPCGVQLLGGRYCEDDLFDAAEIIEARAGRLTPIDPR
ncbi:amidase [Pseudomonas ovata]|uniref:amidase n=1 Tax=Pseudomonas ovata TaxID=1839709 RepID=UPI000D690DC9|nr:amidase [Pseudomonas ovata]